MNKKQIIISTVSIVILFVTVIFFLRNSINNISSLKIPFIVNASSGIIENSSTTLSKDLSRYVEVIDGCNPYFVGECVNMRNGPGTEYPVVVHLRTGVVLRVSGTVTQNGSTWYKIEFAHDLLYPERVKGDWYVNAQFVELITNETDHELTKGEIVNTAKRIVVDVSEQKLYAYDGDKLFMEESISTGLEFTPTPRGIFTVFKMTPSRFMQGPTPGVSDQVYDLPGVPWDLYFTSDGAVIHGAYWHDHFGKPWSHGCVNLSPQNAKKLYDWAVVGIKVTVQN
ncbi:MAG: L,D-transpeptidase family protein [Candidatus Nomurabacteria bacterium]